MTSPVTAYFDRLASYAGNPAHSTAKANAHDECTMRLASAKCDYHREQQTLVGTQSSRSQYTSPLISRQTSQAAVLETAPELTDLECACRRFFILERQLDQRSYAPLRPARRTFPLRRFDNMATLPMTRYYNSDLVSCSQRYLTPTARLPLLNDPIIPHWTGPVRSQIQ